MSRLPKMLFEHYIYSAYCLPICGEFAENRGCDNSCNLAHPPSRVRIFHPRSLRTKYPNGVVICCKIFIQYADCSCRNMLNKGQKDKLSLDLFFHPPGQICRVIRDKISYRGSDNKTVASGYSCDSHDITAEENDYDENGESPTAATAAVDVVDGQLLLEDYDEDEAESSDHTEDDDLEPNEENYEEEDDGDCPSLFPPKNCYFGYGGGMDDDSAPTLKTWLPPRRPLLPSSRHKSIISHSFSSTPKSTVQEANGNISTCSSAYLLQSSHYHSLHSAGEFRNRGMVSVATQTFCNTLKANLSPMARETTEEVFLGNMTPSKIPFPSNFGNSLTPIQQLMLMQHQNQQRKIPEMNQSIWLSYLMMLNKFSNNTTL